MPVEIRPLTSLRFFLALWVLLFHLRDLLVAPPFLERLFALGYVAVPGFFLLSGVVLSWTYLQPSSPAIDRRAFFRARVARILPLYLLGFLIALPLFIGKALASGIAPGELVLPALAVLVMVQSWIPALALMVNSPAWSLSVEAFFYVVFPWIGGWAARRSTAVVVALGVGAVIISWVVAVMAGSAMPGDGWSSAVQEPGRGALTDMARFFPLARLSDFVLGICVGICLIRWKRQADHRLVAATILAGVSGLVSVVVLGDSVPFLMANGPLAEMAFACLLIGLALMPEDWPLHRLLAWPPLLMLGRASFALYILHLPLIDWGWQVAKKVGVGSPASGTLFAVVMLLLLVAVSAVCYRWIEEPLRRRIGGPRRQPGGPPASP